MHSGYCAWETVLGMLRSTERASAPEAISMEMHQVRYFLAVARTRNFTRAAEECNVTQPSLTRAIKQLEGILAEAD